MSTLDLDKIDSFRELDQKASKAALAEYAATFDVKLNKQKSFDNMLLDLTEVVPVPKPEKPEGFASTVVLIDETDGGLDSLLATDDDFPVGTGNPETTALLTDPVVVAAIEEAKADILPIVQKAETEPTEWTLPENYSPFLVPLGRTGSNFGYFTCPWWIYDWIVKNPEWKTNPDLCPHYSARDTLYSLIYFMQRDGSVTVRETRNSKYHTFNLNS